MLFRQGAPSNVLLWFLTLFLYIQRTQNRRRRRRAERDKIYKVKKKEMMMDAIGRLVDVRFVYTWQIL